MNILPKTSGIYRFLNWVNGKMYVGSAVNIKNRNKNHLIELKLNRHFNRYLQSAWNKYGAENFIFEILELVENKENLKIREQFYIDKFNSSNREFGYNLAPIASSPLGVKHTVEDIAKAVEGRKGYRHSDETKLRIAISNTGKTHTLETKAKLTKSLKGRTLTQEHIDNRTAAQRNTVDWPCLNGYKCKCGMCKDKRAAIMREFRKSKLEKLNGIT